MSKASEVMRFRAVSDRPYGYLFVDESNPKKFGYPLTECELQLCHDGLTITLTILIFENDLGNRSYRLSVFNGDDWSVPVIFSKIHYVGVDSQSLEHDTVVVDDRFMKDHDKLVRALYAIVYYQAIAEQQPREDDEQVDPERPYPIAETEKAYIESLSPLGISEIISIVKNLLGC